MMAVLRLARVTLVVWVAFAVSCTASTPVTFTDAQISDILRKAVANWLHAIYAQDLDALRAASASEQLYRDGLFLMDDETFQFMEEPSADLIDITIHTCTSTMESASLWTTRAMQRPSSDKGGRVVTSPRSGKSKACGH